MRVRGAILAGVPASSNVVAGLTRGGAILRLLCCSSCSSLLALAACSPGATEAAPVTFGSIPSEPTGAGAVSDSVFGLDQSQEGVVNTSNLRAGDGGLAWCTSPSPEQLSVATDLSPNTTLRLYSGGCIPSDGYYRACNDAGLPIYAPTCDATNSGKRIEITTSGHPVVAMRADSLDIVRGPGPNGTWAVGPFDSGDPRQHRDERTPLHARRRSRAQAGRVARPSRRLRGGRSQSPERFVHVLAEGRVRRVARVRDRPVGGITVGNSHLRDREGPLPRSLVALARRDGRAQKRCFRLPEGSDPHCGPYLYARARLRRRREARDEGIRRTGLGTWDGALSCVAWRTPKATLRNPARSGGRGAEATGVQGGRATTLRELGDRALPASPRHHHLLHPQRRRRRRGAKIEVAPHSIDSLPELIHVERNRNLAHWVRELPTLDPEA